MKVLKTGGEFHMVHDFNFNYRPPMLSVQERVVRSIMPSKWAIKWWWRRLHVSYKPEFLICPWGLS